jgi:hypothetical protein
MMAISDELLVPRKPAASEKEMKYLENSLGL